MMGNKDFEDVEFSIKEIDEEDEEEDYIAEQELIDDREDDLDVAIYDLMDVFVPNFAEMWDKCWHIKDMSFIYDSIKDKVCEILYEEFGISIYRPMFLFDESGAERFSEFPYSEATTEEIRTSLDNKYPRFR